MHRSVFFTFLMDPNDSHYFTNLAENYGVTPIVTFDQHQAMLGQCRRTVVEGVFVGPLHEKDYQLITETSNQV